MVLFKRFHALRLCLVGVKRERKENLGGGWGGGCVFHCLVEERKGRGRKNWMGDIHLGSQILILPNREENEITTLPLCYHLSQG